MTTPNSHDETDVESTVNNDLIIEVENKCHSIEWLSNKFEEIQQVNER